MHPRSCPAPPSTIACVVLSIVALAESVGASAVFFDRSGSCGIDVVNRCGEEPRMFIPESNGSGAAWLDYDLDGDLDLYVVNGNGLEYLEGGAKLHYLRDATNRLYRNDGNWSYADVTELARVGDEGWGNGAAVGDVDGDGDPDVYVANLGPDVFYENLGDGTFRESALERGLGHEGWSTGAAFGDVDLDGDLDLFVPCYVEFDPGAPPEGGRPMVYEGVELPWGPEGENPGINRGAHNVFYLNDGSGIFTEATDSRGLGREEALCSYAAVFSDVDLDGWPDLLVTNDVQPNSLFLNRGDGFFVESGEERGFARGADGKFQAGMGLAVADVDADGDPDVYVTNFDFEPNNLYLNDGRGRFEDAGKIAGLHDPSTPLLGWGCAFFDLELDGDLDLLVANGHVLEKSELIGMNPWKMPNQLFVQQERLLGIPSFELVSVAATDPLARIESSRAVVAGDPDDDGDLDFVILDLDRAPQVLENRAPRGGDWVRVRAVGTRSSRDSYGARVEVSAGGRMHTAWVNPNQGIYSSHDPRVLVGLGPVDRVDRIRVVWPSGLTKEKTELAPNRDHVFVEPELSVDPAGGSR